VAVKTQGGKKKKKSELRQAITIFSQIGVSIAACLFIGIMLGKFLDEWLGTSPLLILICTFLGLAAAIRAIFVFGMRK